MHFACLSVFDQINEVLFNIPVQPGPKFLTQHVQNLTFLMWAGLKINVYA